MLYCTAILRYEQLIVMTYLIQFIYNIAFHEVLHFYVDMATANIFNFILAFIMILFCLTLCLFSLIRYDGEVINLDDDVSYI